MKRPVWPLTCFVYSRKVIRLASDANVHAYQQSRIVVGRLAQQDGCRYVADDLAGQRRHNDDQSQPIRDAPQHHGHRHAEERGVCHSVPLVRQCFLTKSSQYKLKNRDYTSKGILRRPY